METPVYLEIGKTKVFACSVEWPGWCRSGRGEEAAMEALLDYEARYRAAVGTFPEPGTLEVVERIAGNGTTEFGAPDVVPALDVTPFTAEEGARQAAVLDAALVAFERAIAAAPVELPKGPRGGGRDRQPIADHVREANRAYGRKVGIRHPPGTPLAETVGEVGRLLALGSDGTPPIAGGWPLRYAARRIAWHVLDHAWELEDKSLVG